jgi:hypothetical protein
VTRSSLALAALAALCMAPSAARALDLPGPTGLGAAELAALGQGEPVIRLLKGAGELSLPEAAPGGRETRAAVARLKPNYLVEVVASYPSAALSDALRGLAAALDDVEGYVGIPYYSEKNKKTYDLFDRARVLSRSGEAGAAAIEAAMHMKPFEDYRARYEVSLSAEALLFTGANLDNLVYKGVKAVKPGEMLWRIVAYRAGDRILFFGVGAVKAFDLFGAARDRLEPSFIGRTRAFFESMRARIGK